jgi:phosphatidylglycerol:prolipoprotein diacylglycerol transferase
MLPELFRIGPITVHTFGFALAVAFLVIAWLVSKEFVRRGFSSDLGGTITLATMVGGVLGAKIYYLVDHWSETMADPAGSVFSGSGLTFYGGLIGGSLAGIWVARRHRIAIPHMGDIIAPLLALGYGIGRIGCFLNGDDYGKPTDAWYGMAFPKGQPPTLDKVIPTQIVESASGFLFFALLWSLRARWQEHHGRLFGAYLVLQGIERFLIEYARTNQPVGPFTMAQWISLGLIVIGAWLIGRSANR